MRLGGTARYVVEITSTNELVAAVSYARDRGIPWFVLGAGSNVIAQGNYDGLIILNRIKGFELVSQDCNFALYRIGAGEIWDETVERLVNLRLSGVEAMSAIPGYMGATPIQNVGAYGQEIAHSLVELEAYDTNTNQFSVLRAEDCRFSYRNSIFKNPKTRHHIISSVTLRLGKQQLAPPFYPSLAEHLETLSITDFSPVNLRNAVIAIRGSKLPDPQLIASAGSFFKNPVVGNLEARELLALHPSAPHWEMSDGLIKFSAGWLIEMAGLKSYRAHGMQIYPDNALVVTNLCARSPKDLELFKAEVVLGVKTTFGITLEQEPEYIPDISLRLT